MAILYLGTHLSRRERFAAFRPNHSQHRRRLPTSRTYLDERSSQGSVVPGRGLGVGVELRLTSLADVRGQQEAAGAARGGQRRGAGYGARTFVYRAGQPALLWGSARRPAAEEGRSCRGGRDQEVDMPHAGR